MLDWFKGGSDWLHKGAKFTVTDVRTGKSFRARRFGGWYHADSEPITTYDTGIMKSLEGFSWNRRAHLDYVQRKDRCREHAYYAAYGEPNAFQWV